MKITKESKYVPETQSQTTNSMLISSDLSVQSLYQILTKNPQLINKTDKNGETFLSYALKRKNIDVCEFLLTSPVLDLTFQDDDGNSYLHLAADIKSDTISLILIKKGIDINGKNFTGNTPLHIAFMNDDTKLKNILIENGADISIKNNNNETPDEVMINADNISLRVSNSNDISKAMNDSIKIDWSEQNIVPSYNKQFSLSNANNKEVYAKSFVEPTNHNRIRTSTDTRYNSSNKNNEEDFDLFDLTNSIEQLRKENNDKVVLLEDDNNKIVNKIDDGDDMVNTRFSHEDSNHIVYDAYKDAQNIPNGNEIVEEKKEEPKKAQEDVIKTPITFDDEDPFAFSSPHIKEIKEENGITTDTKPHIGNLPDMTNIVIANKASPLPAMPSEQSIQNGNDSQLYKFLSKINMEKYHSILTQNGFDDITLIVNQTKHGIGITDSNLKEAGILLPGDRAKILILVQQAAKNFPFEVPNSVYYTCTDMSNVDNDPHIKKLSNWLKSLKVESYLNNFVSNGYHSLELLQLQMESKQPLTNEILMNEIGIEKIGYRARIINKLKEEGRTLWNKLKTSVLIIDKGGNNKFCECIVF